MRTLKAAGLILVGWYLMMPPPNWTKTNTPTPPLREWTLFGHYGSADECSDERFRMIRVQYMALLSDLAEGASDDPNLPSLKLDFKDAQCVATDIRGSKNRDPLRRTLRSRHEAQPHRRARSDRLIFDAATDRGSSSPV
jgi:hypothetical protein